MLITMVTKPGFTALINTLDKRYSLPSPTCFSQVAIPELYRKCKQRVTAELKTAEFVYYNRKIQSLYVLKNTKDKELKK